MKKEIIKDLLEMMSQPNVNKALILEAAYKRGFIDGKEFAKEKAIEAIKNEK